MVGDPSIVLFESSSAVDHETPARRSLTSHILILTTITMAARKDVPLDETRWAAPEWAHHMGGVHSNSGRLRQFAGEKLSQGRTLMSDSSTVLRKVALL